MESKFKMHGESNKKTLNRSLSAIGLFVTAPHPGCLVVWPRVAVA
jgi:hypothetical protein